jgi:hypothetical protein
MKKISFTLILSICFLSSNAQDLAVNLRLDLAKTFQITKKQRLRITQTFQFNPEVEKLDEPNDNDLFNEIDLFPLPIRANTASKPVTNKPQEPENPFNEINDDPKEVSVAWRSSTNLAYTYNLFKTVRIGAGYGLLLDRSQLRHLFSSDITYTPDIDIKKVKFPQRIAFQLATRENDGEIEWQHDLSARSGFEWKFKNKHTFYSQGSVNGAIDDGEWDWDRLRLEAGLKYEFSKKHAFEFSYRYQQRLDKKRRTSNGIGFRYTVNL